MTDLSKFIGCVLFVRDDAFIPLSLLVNLQDNNISIKYFETREFHKDAGYLMPSGALSLDDGGSVGILMLK